ncbi:MAG: hypothetical protein ACP5PT_05505 [Brevinematia bacterium]
MRLRRRALKAIFKQSSDILRRYNTLIYNTSSMLKVEKINGEYQFISPNDPWINKAILTISENLEFKTMVLHNFISANTKILDINDQVQYKKLNSLILIDGKNFEIISNDNIYQGTIILSPENFKSLSNKRSIGDLDSLAQDYKVIIEKEKFKAIYRNPKYTLKLISFFLYRKIGIIPSELLIEKLAIVLQEVIPINFEEIEIKLVPLSRYFLPNEILFSIEISINKKKNYYLLKYHRKKWTIKSVNLQKGSVNFIHKLLLETLEFLSSQEWWKKLEKTISELKNFLKSKFILELFVITVGLIILIYLTMRIRFLIDLIVIYVLWLIYKRTCLFLVFRREVDAYGKLQRSRS